MLRVASLLALGAALVEAAKKKVEAPPPEPTMMATLKDMVLFDGEFKFLFWVCLVGFCAGNLRMILTQTPNIRFVHGLVLGVLNCYGGSTLAAIICGQPVPFVVNEKLIVGFSLTWVVAYSLPAVFMSVVKGTSSGAILISVTYEILRCHVMINCHRMASGVLKAGLFGVPTIGPLICGTLGGCGGGFFPLNKGLEPLEGETNWRGRWWRPPAALPEDSAPSASLDQLKALAAPVEVESPPEPL